MGTLASRKLIKIECISHLFLIVPEFLTMSDALDAAKQGTHYYDKEWRVLDQIIVSQGFIGAKKGYKFNPKNAFILKKDFVLFKNNKTGEERPNRTYSGEKYHNGYSDHLSIYITLD